MSRREAPKRKFSSLGDSGVKPHQPHRETGKDTSGQYFTSNRFTRNNENGFISRVRSEGTECFSSRDLVSISDLPSEGVTLTGGLLRFLTSDKNVTFSNGITRVQTASFKAIVSSTRHAIINAATGSGKTLAYGLPLIQGLLNYETEVLSRSITRGDGCLSLVICPTREVAVQTHAVIEQLTHFLPGIVVGIVCGGEVRHKEKARLRKGITVLVCTPGRLLDHLNSTESFLQTIHKVRSFILDEADRILELGFEKQIRQIFQIVNNRKIKAREQENLVKHIQQKTQEKENEKENDSENEKKEEKPERLDLQVVLLSATIPPSLTTLARTHLDMKDPLFVRASSLDDDDDDNNNNNNNNNNDDDNDNDNDNEGTSSNKRVSGAYAGDLGNDAEELLGCVSAVPSNLKQFYVECPTKLRAVGLASFLSSAVARNRKVLVFFNCRASVEFHYHLFKSMAAKSLQQADNTNNDNETPEDDLENADANRKMYAQRKLDQKEDRMQERNNNRKGGSWNRNNREEEEEEEEMEVDEDDVPKEFLEALRKQRVEKANDNDNDNANDNSNEKENHPDHSNPCIALKSCFGVSLLMVHGDASANDRDGVITHFKSRSSNEGCHRNFHPFFETHRASSANKTIV